MEGVFLGSEALASGALTRYELRTFYRRVLPDVYAPKRAEPMLYQRATAAWLWSHREGVISGVTASALLGADWVDADVVIELNWPNHRAPPGVRTRNDTILDDEVMTAHNLPVTTPERTAFDLARRGSVGEAVQRLDALARATHFKAEDVQLLAQRHPHVRGLRRVDRVLDLVDPGAESPRESWLRMMLISEGYRRPATQIPVPGADGYPRYYLDMGWEDILVAVEYDGTITATIRRSSARTSNDSSTSPPRDGLSSVWSRATGGLRSSSAWSVRCDPVAGFEPALRAKLSRTSKPWLQSELLDSGV